MPKKTARKLNDAEITKILTAVLGVLRRKTAQIRRSPTNREWERNADASWVIRQSKDGMRRVLAKLKL